MDKNILNLGGLWRAAADKTNGEGFYQGWYERGIPEMSRIPLTRRQQPNYIMLPGTTDDAHIGHAFNPGYELTLGLDRAYAWDNDVWFEKEITIPQSFEGKQVELAFERTFYFSRVWVDGKPLGEYRSCATPHRYDATGSITPGKHRITININALKPEGFGGHHMTPGNGALWNGIIGYIKLLARDSVHISAIQCYPDVSHRSVKLKTSIKNHTGHTMEGSVQWIVRLKETGALAASVSSSVVFVLGETVFEPEVSLTPALLWDEFEPNLYIVEAVIKGESFEDRRECIFGLREIKVEGTQISINGCRVLLRGTHEGCQFPLHGNPPMDEEEWRRCFTAAKQYGMNHIRFHSWCPPDAAFCAADSLGLYLQVEMSGGHSTELPRILDTFGNHPSFISLTLGNELFNHNDGDDKLEEYLPQRWGNNDSVNKLSSRRLVKMAQKYDPRHLYSCTSHPVSQVPCADDFYVSAWGRNGKPTVGIRWGGGDVQTTSRFNTYPPETASDYREALEGIEKPLISHEVGQWAVYPNLAESHKYTGVLINHNYDLFREHLREKGMLHQAADFTLASGRLSVELYKEEIESALRTPGFGGFQLLDLHDYPGQGVATIGILDAFWESKGLVAPSVFCEFCGPVVPLARLGKRVYKKSDHLKARIEAANYSREVIKGARPVWYIIDSMGAKRMEGMLDCVNIGYGRLSVLGYVDIDLSNLPAPEKYTLVVKVTDNIKNRWSIWLYPDGQDVSYPSGVRVFKGWSDDVLEALDMGEKVLLFPDIESLSDARPGCFTSEFWTPHNKPVPPARTMGLLIDSSHPVFKSFPTDFHSDWQWWYLVMNSAAMVLDDAAYTLKPIVQVIDNFDSNEKLGSLFECRVGSGKLMVCAFDLESSMESRLPARQFAESLYRYLESDEFNPVTELNHEMIKAIASPRPGRGSEYGFRG